MSESFIFKGLAATVVFHLLSQNSMPANEDRYMRALAFHYLSVFSGAIVLVGLGDALAIKD